MDKTCAYSQAAKNQVVHFCVPPLPLRLQNGSSSGTAFLLKRQHFELSSALDTQHGNFARAFYSERISYFSQNYREVNSFT